MRSWPSLGNEFACMWFIFYRNLDLTEYRSTLVIDEPTETSWNPLRGDTSLSRANIPKSEIEFPFLVAQVDYNPDLYLPILRTLYKVSRDWNLRFIDGVEACCRSGKSSASLPSNWTTLGTSRIPRKWPKNWFKSIDEDAFCPPGDGNLHRALHSDTS